MAARKQAGDDGAKRGPGRPARFAEGELRNTTFLVRPASLAWLDSVLQQAKDAGLSGAFSQEFSRSAVLRGILAGLKGLDLTGCDSEEAVRKAVEEAIRKRR